jgi:hypothetical protein
MRVAAIASDRKLWEKMFSDSLEEGEVRKIAAAVHKSAMAWIRTMKSGTLKKETRTVNSEILKTFLLYPPNGPISQRLCQNQMIARH